MRTAKMLCFCAATMLLAAPIAHAEMVLSQVVVDLQPGQPNYSDIEVWNSGAERLYVVAEPAIIDRPGRPDQARVPVTDPSVGGLLVTPQRMVLEPDQRRLLRISAILPRAAEERTWRVTVKPVTGQLSADATALKVVVGYDVLVLQRPETTYGAITARREGNRIVFFNQSNVAQEMFDGRQCDEQGENCIDLEAIRLYPGATFAQPLRYQTAVQYRTTFGSGTVLSVYR